MAAPNDTFLQNFYYGSHTDELRQKYEALEEILKSDPNDRSAINTKIAKIGNALLEISEKTLKECRTPSMAHRNEAKNTANGLRAFLNSLSKHNVNIWERKLIDEKISALEKLHQHFNIGVDLSAAKTSTKSNTGEFYNDTPEANVKPLNFRTKTPAAVPTEAYKGAKTPAANEMDESEMKLESQEFDPSNLLKEQGAFYVHEVSKENYEIFFRKGQQVHKVVLGGGMSASTWGSIGDGHQGWIPVGKNIWNLPELLDFLEANEFIDRSKNATPWS